MWDSGLNTKLINLHSEWLSEKYNKKQFIWFVFFALDIVLKLA